jgi:chemotaxis protein MotB
MPNHLLIEGHTNSVPYAPENKYSNWELSTDRANSARRLMEQEGVRPDQTSYVRGYADRNLRKPDAPEDPSNRRISIVIQYQQLSAEPAKTEPGKHGATDAKVASHAAAKPQESKTSPAKPQDSKAQPGHKPEHK